jgi:hypothetical protein
MSYTKLSLSVYKKLSNDRLKIIFKDYMTFHAQSCVYVVQVSSRKSQQQASVVPSTLPWLLGLCKLPL